ncbi:hypothetical protein FE251_09230 [Georgenia wutianyii]|uniref:Uncharacterized protein n=1 Tax=Georgenia wutianyii TaxID=2585135 RepID=A0ABX5VNY0_9MICO|nr:hypothetical protein [Georgenia wutianyii]QDB79536.1 hypothetical protein FE251_09230 [Georgenia wutianyii]
MTKPTPGDLTKRQQDAATAPETAEASAATQVPAAPERATEEPEPRSEEAKRYRLRLREAEAERDALRERLETMQRAEVERTANLEHPEAVWIGAEFDAFLDGDGNIDAERIAAHVATLGEKYGIQQRKPKIPRIGFILDQSGRPDTYDRPASGNVFDRMAESLSFGV